MSRRHLLAGAGAALGVGALAGAPRAEAAPSPQTATQPASAARRLVLTGSALTRSSARGRPEPGDPISVVGLLGTPGDAGVTGRFFATGVIVRHFDLQSFENHHFDLADGTLTGSGTVTPSGVGRFTITGGSGRWAGARGTYATTQSADLAGTGEAVFTFSFE